MTAPLSSLVATWANGATVFTAVKMNVTDSASATTSLLMDLQVGSASKFSVDKRGSIAAAALTIPIVDKGSVGTGTVTFDASVAAKQKLTVTGSLTVAYSNWPASGTYGEVEVQLVNGGSATVTWPTVSWLKGDGTNSTTFSTMGVTLYTSGTNFVIVWTTDGGTTLYGRAA